MVGLSASKKDREQEGEIGDEEMGMAVVQSGENDISVGDIQVEVESEVEVDDKCGRISALHLAWIRTRGGLLWPSPQLQ